MPGLGRDCPHSISTNLPSTVRCIEAAYAERGCQFLDTTVSTASVAALQRIRTQWVSGNAGTAASFKPVVEAVGAMHVGSVRTATITELVNNCATSDQAAGRRVHHGVRAGANSVGLFTALRPDNFGNDRTYDGLINQFLPGVFDPASFALRLAHKDVALATKFGQRGGRAHAHGQCHVRGVDQRAGAGLGRSRYPGFRSVAAGTGWCTRGSGPRATKAAVANDC
jgi:3-hydroxyisobutyrate dehydrogenase-like beta-hydroxyacid dehydrogenase